MNKLLIYLFFIVFNLSVNAQLVKLSIQPDGVNTTRHRCVLDTQTQLIWEVKLHNEGLQNLHNTYTWFDGKSGVENGAYSHHCHWSQYCNTQTFINALNKTKLCQKNTWRLPNEQELKTLLVYADDDLLINQTFFPNTKLKSYWSSDEVNQNIAIDVPFFYGGSKSADKSFDAHIRAVSNAN